LRLVTQHVNRFFGTAHAAADRHRADAQSRELQHARDRDDRQPDVRCLQIHNHAPVTGTGRSAGLFRSSSMIDDAIAVVGMARMAPTSPNHAAPTSNARNTASELRPTCRPMILGIRMFASISCSTRNTIATENARLSDTVSASSTAKSPASNGP